MASPGHPVLPPATTTGGVPLRQAERHLFWRSLYPHAVPFAPLLMLLRPGFFKPDRDLIHSLATATTPEHFHEEISDYVMNSANAGWARNKAKLRVSTRRIERFALLCLGPDTPIAKVRHTQRSAAHASDPRQGQRRR